MGRVLAALRELDLQKETVVAYTSDHGEMLGDPGALGQVRVLRGVVRRAADRCAVPVSQVELLPTLGELCGVDVPQLGGKSLVPQLRDAGTRQDDAVFAEFNLRTPRAKYMIRRGDYKYTFRANGDVPEPYDPRSDWRRWITFGEGRGAGARRRDEGRVVRVVSAAGGEGVVSYHWRAACGLPPALCVLAACVPSAEGIQSAGARPHEFPPNCRDFTFLYRGSARLDREHRGTSDGPDRGGRTRGVGDGDQLRDRGRNGRWRQTRGDSLRETGGSTNEYFSIGSQTSTTRPGVDTRYSSWSSWFPRLN